MNENMALQNTTQPCRIALEISTSSQRDSLSNPSLSYLSEYFWKNPPCCLASTPKQAWFSEFGGFGCTVLSLCSNVTDNRDFVLSVLEKVLLLPG